MNRLSQPIALTLALLLLAPAVLPAAGSSPQPAAPETPVMLPDQKAIAAYNEGIENRDKAWQLEADAAGAVAEKQAKKIQKAYEKAIEDYRTAVELKPDFYQAWGSLGYALRKTGRYGEALEAYDRALAIEPTYAEAIEYRGEAYLGLDRLDDAKGAYMELFQIDRDRAAELMTAMQRWLEARRSDAGGLAGEAIEGFATWIEERINLATQVGTLASAGRSW